MRGPDQFKLKWHNKGKVDVLIDQLASREGDTVKALQRLWAYISDSKSPDETLDHVLNRFLTEMDTTRQTAFFQNIWRTVSNSANVPCLTDDTTRVLATHLATSFHEKLGREHPQWFRDAVKGNIDAIKFAIKGVAFEPTQWEVPALIISDLAMWSIEELRAFREFLFKLREIRSHGCHRFSNVAVYLSRSGIYKKKHPLHRHLNIIVGEFDGDTIQRGTWTDDGKTIAGLNVAELRVMIDYVKGLIEGRT